MIVGAESTCHKKDRKPSIMDGNPADWEACIASPSWDYGHLTSSLLLSKIRRPTALFITCRHSPQVTAPLLPWRRSSCLTTPFTLLVKLRLCRRCASNYDTYSMGVALYAPRTLRWPHLRRGWRRDTNHYIKYKATNRLIMLDYENRPVKDIPGLPLTLAGESEGWLLEGLRRCTKIEVNE